MSLKETLKAEGQQEKEKLLNMSWQDRIWYIWEYYKIHILIAVLIFLFLYLFATALYNSTFDTRLSYVVVNNTNTERADFEEFNQKFKDYMEFGKKDKIEADGSVSIQLGGMPSQIDYGNMAKLSAMAASNNLDMIITDADMIQYYTEMDAFADLEQFLPDDLWQQINDSIYYAKNSEGAEVACAFDLNSTCFPEQTGIAITPCYLGILADSTRNDTVISWIRFVLEQP